VAPTADLLDTLPALAHLRNGDTPTHLTAGFEAPQGSVGCRRAETGTNRATSWFDPTADTPQNRELRQVTAEHSAASDGFLVGRVTF
jgi:hypothetical protein